MSDDPIFWSCACGAVKARAEGEGTRAVCYCSSCREFAERFGRAGWVDPSGGCDLYQTAPECVVLTEGADQLRWTKLTPKGPLRWYARCCGTPMANTLGTRNIPFVTLQVVGFDDPDKAGPVVARVNRQGATGPVPDDAGGLPTLLWTFAKRALASRLSGRYKKNLFFDAAGEPIAGRQDP